MGAAIHPTGRAPRFESGLATIRAAWAALPDKPEETPERTAAALWLAAAGTPRAAAGAESASLPELDAAGLARFDGLLERRLGGEPLAYITGRQAFFGVELLAAPGALIPRAETELLAAAAVECLRLAPEGRREALDLCTGSGNVALAVAHHVPDARVIGMDLSEEAVELARRNAVHVGVADRTTFLASDLFAAIDDDAHHERFALVTCNPPYITSQRVPQMPGEIANYEPRLAFDGGRLGLDIVLRVISNAPRFLAPGGWLCMEVGQGQGDFIIGRVGRNPQYASVTPITDHAGNVRGLRAQRSA